MATVEQHNTRFRGSRDLLEARAARAGFELVNRVTDAGLVVWEWRRGDEPRPQFVTERVARHWMFQLLARAGLEKCEV
jgi:hypothetical protein